MNKIHHSFMILTAFAWTWSACAGAETRPSAKDKKETAITVQQLGKAYSLEGRVVHAKGKILVIGEDGKAYSPTSGKKALSAPKKPETIASSPSQCRDASLESDLKLDKGMKLKALAKGDVGPLKNVTIAVVELPADPASEAPLLEAPGAILNIYQGESLLHSQPIELDAYACGIVLDDFDSKKAGNEIGIAWMSLGASYSAGASVFSVSR